VAPVDRPDVPRLLGLPEAMTRQAAQDRSGPPLPDGAVPREDPRLRHARRAL